MNAPIKDPSSTESQIVVTWSPLTLPADTGDSTILSYNLEWDFGSGYQSLIGLSTNSLATSFTVSSVSAGTSYNFRLKAKNIYGFGPYSSVTTIVASGIPSQMA